MKLLSLASLLAFVPVQNAGSQETAGPATLAKLACSRPGQIWWNELLATDTDKLAGFYSDVIGWTNKAVDPENTKLAARTVEDRYILFGDGLQDAAGLIKLGHRDAAHSGSGWFMYIHVADIDAALTKVEEKGGKVLRAAFTTGEGDRIAVVSDPLGNAFGLVTPAKTGC
jgi:predicted enzyme related to lactoylglutathione lyase